MRHSLRERAGGASRAGVGAVRALRVRHESPHIVLAHPVAHHLNLIPRLREELDRDVVRIATDLFSVRAEPPASGIFGRVAGNCGDLDRVPVAHHLDLLIDPLSYSGGLRGIREPSEESLRSPFPYTGGE